VEIYEEMVIVGEFDLSILNSLSKIHQRSVQTLKKKNKILVNKDNLFGLIKN